MQWNFNLERQLAKGLTATVGYVGSRGVHQPFRQDNFDMVLPTLTPAGYLFPPAATSKTLNPNYGRITGTLWQANSFYHALQAVVTKSLSHGVQFHGAYTWSKSIDTLSATVADDAFPNGLMNPLFFDQRTSRGLSDFDVGQNFVVNLTWEDTFSGHTLPARGLGAERMAIGRHFQGFERSAIYPDFRRGPTGDETRRDCRASELGGWSGLRDTLESRQSQPLHPDTVPGFSESIQPAGQPGP